jgi:hypothetical protein
MNVKVEGESSPHKRFRIRRDVDGSEILASFDTLEEAIAWRRRRRNWAYVILDVWTIVWPLKRAKA